METHLNRADIDHAVDEVVPNLDLWVLSENLPRDSHMFGGRDADDGFVVETLRRMRVKDKHA